VLRGYLTHRAKRITQAEEVSQPQRGLLSLRSAVIFAIATAGGLVAGHWAQPEIGLGAWMALVLGLDTIIDGDQPK
jgi:hypothetical protein